MIRLIRYGIARMLINCMTNQQMSEKTAKRWNHLQAVILTRGKIYFDYYILFNKDVVKCKRCLSRIKEGTHCERCENEM